MESALFATRKVIARSIGMWPEHLNLCDANSTIVPPLLPVSARIVTRKVSLRKGFSFLSQKQANLCVGHTISDCKNARVVDRSGVEDVLPEVAFEQLKAACLAVEGRDDIDDVKEVGPSYILDQRAHC